jgi:pterin-4a-carbinolamine dehydratase
MKWKRIENKLVKTYLLEKNSEISDRIQALILIADAHKKSPVFQLENNQIKFELQSKKIRAVSKSDFKMARIIDQLFG